jgi:hypothetical protein
MSWFEPAQHGHAAAGRRVDRVEPDRVDAEPLEIPEALRHSGEVADPVPVRVGERARVDLI